jgi:23S rRNA pseudouridine1911/1915/1917 synthase
MPDFTGFEVLYDHQGILVVNKSFGTPSQPNKNYDPDVYTQLAENYQYIGQHHRLDQTASGLLLFSTRAELNHSLSQAFKKHRIHREYWIWVVGNPPADGIWKQSIDSKKALSVYQKCSQKGLIAHLNVTLETGRTHQIRRHAQINGFPIIGDHRYGGQAKTLWARLALHAHRLTFTHPITETVVTIDSPLPNDLLGVDK